MIDRRWHADCIGLGREYSLLHDYFGHRRAPADLSILKQDIRVRREHIHLNIIRVGFDVLTPEQRDAAQMELDFAVHRTREIYDQARIGIARVQHYAISAEDAGSLIDIGSDGEAEDLTDKYSVDNDAIDVFFVANYEGNLGSAPKPPGSCNKNGKGQGIVLSIEGDTRLTGKVLAHEIGHYLGVGHSGNKDHLMHQSEPDPDKVEITEDQRFNMRDHCFIAQCEPFGPPGPPPDPLGPDEDPDPFDDLDDLNPDGGGI